MNAKDKTRAMLLKRPHAALVSTQRALPPPEPGQLLIDISACGVCRTDLHLVDAELPHPKLPIVPGHEVIGRVARIGADHSTFLLGQRVGVPWLGWTCGSCEFCQRGQENLCPSAKFTGYTLDGGYAEQMLVDERYCFPIQGDTTDAQAAPLMCAGLIGYRSYAMTGDAEVLGIYGFGAAAHIISQIAAAQGRTVFAFVRPGDTAAMRFAEDLGVAWAGPSDAAPPRPMDAAMIFAAVGSLVPVALSAVRPGGTVICAGIHMSDIPSFPYSILWGERSLKSVANLTRRDALEFLTLVQHHPVKTTVTEYPLSQAQAALSDLREGRLQGAAVLRP